MKTNNQKLLDWVAEIEAMCQPDSVEWADGSKAEYDRLMQLMVDTGMATKLNEEKRPNSFSVPQRSQRRGAGGSPYLYCLQGPEDAGPTNNWIDPAELKQTMTELYTRLHEGPYDVRDSLLHGPGRLADFQDRHRDHRFAVRRGQHAHHDACWRQGLGGTGRGRRVHSLPALGRRASGTKAKKDVPWPCAPMEEKYIAHFPEENLIWSYGSGYGGNALLGKKCLALRIASTWPAEKAGWPSTC